MGTIEKRLITLEAGKDRQEIEVFHIIRYGATKGPDRKYYAGDPFVIVHEAQEVSE